MGNMKRFWEKVNVMGDDDCWAWTRNRLKSGYGLFRYSTEKQLLAHRFSYELTIGLIPKDMFVCHKCDNPPCVNPKHLFLGYPKDNTRDMITKGRQTDLHEIRKRLPKGESHWNCKLRDSQKYELCVEYKRGTSKVSLCSQYGVSRRTVNRVLKEYS